MAQRLMAVCVFDSTFLLLLTDDVAAAPIPPFAVSDHNEAARDRIRFLIETLDSARINVVVPTPVLTEILSSSGTDIAATWGILNNLARIRVESFGQLAAIECAALLRRRPGGGGPRSKVKFDHQIVAIAKVVGARTVYSDDQNVKTLCRREKMDHRGVWDLPARPVDPQGSLIV